MSDNLEQPAGVGGMIGKLGPPAATVEQKRAQLASYGGGSEFQHIATCQCFFEDHDTLMV
jgi:hypothetical protein